MSSYEIGGADLGATLLAGPVAIGASIAILASYAGGYAIYSAGKAIYDSLAREHQKSLERQAQEQARERARLEKVQKTRREIITKCNERITELKAGDYFNNPYTASLANTILLELQAISNYDENNDVDNIELRNKLDIQRIMDLTENLKRESALIYEKNAENLSMLSFIETIESLFVGLSVDEYYFVKDIQVQDSEKVLIKNLLSKMDTLKEKFYEIVAREVERIENCPIKSYESNRIADIFKQINSEFASINYEDAEVWILESKIDSIEKYIDTYGTYKYELDKEQEKFLSLYIGYKESCEKVKETYKEAVEFNSIEELENEIRARKDSLERLQKCWELLEELRKETGSEEAARELYICYAIETELNKMNYVVADKLSAETMVGKKLKNYRLKEKLIQYYEYGNDSMMQLFKVNDEVGLQLIVHSDGTSTMETVSLKETDDETVVKIQEEHCEKRRKLEETLKQNWGIEIVLEEKKSANHIAFEFETEKVDDRHVNTSIDIRRKKAIEKKRRNTEKKKERSMALRY